jgi:BolA family transcriptional regulator, general stress-responsive regulator
MESRPVALAMRRKLEAALAPLLLEIDDDSAKHAGHVGARAGGESHFSVRVVSAAFAGKSRVERQRLVHGILAEELAGPVHALALALKAPAEI